MGSSTTPRIPPGYFFHHHTLLKMNFWEYRSFFPQYKLHIFLKKTFSCGKNIFFEQLVSNCSNSTSNLRVKMKFEMVQFIKIAQLASMRRKRTR